VGSAFDDAVMGELIRFVSAHEVGHTLGLPHNWGGANAYTVEQLRSPGLRVRERDVLFDHGLRPLQLRRSARG
jgi:hypothetical protein